MKLCRNCRHLVLAEHGLAQYDYATCAHPVTETTKVSPVDGIVRTTFKQCEMANKSDNRPFAEFVRGEHGYCGPDAKLFDARDVQAEIRELVTL